MVIEAQAADARALPARITTPTNRSQIVCLMSHLLRRSAVPNKADPRRHGAGIVPIGRALGSGVAGPSAQNTPQPLFLALKRVDALAHAAV